MTVFMKEKSQQRIVGPRVGLGTADPDALTPIRLVGSEQGVPVSYNDEDEEMKK
jgi:hypothetical protein